MAALGPLHADFAQPQDHISSKRTYQSVTHKRFVAIEQAASEHSFSGPVFPGSNRENNALFSQLATHFAEGGEGNEE